MKKKDHQTPPVRVKYLITLLNIVIGWHLFYEGIIKIIDPTWSSAGYLEGSKGFLSGFFQSIAESSQVIPWVDLLNIAGLTVIGFLILTGIFTRRAAIAGAVLVGLYYLAQPPWTATDIGYASEGHYLIVDKNLVEVVALLVIASLPKTWYYGLGQLIPGKTLRFSPKPVRVPKEANHEPDKKTMDRRQLIKGLITLPFVGGFFFAFAKNHGWQSFEETNLAGRLDSANATTGATVKVSDPVDLSKLKKPVTKGNLGGHEISRMICGGNLISGFAHSRDLIYVSNWLKQYFTDKKVLDTFWLCEQAGINTSAVRTAPPEINLLNQYWKQGGTMKWLAPVYPEEKNYKENIDMAIDNGAIAATIMGNVGDKWAREGKFELMAKTLDYIKSKGVPAGVTGHELNTIKGAEEHNVGADFYMKTIHSRNYWSWKPEQEKDKWIIDNYSIDNYWARTPDETIRFMESINKPWIAYKILAAGAIPPKDAFRYAFENGADFACVGMFDFQVVEDANIFTEVLEDPKFNRKRSWMA
ncbi:MAG: DoxX family protein, partial [Bacteroidales bacterium]|nr:DoxX family protein [Bacteroidales bacterium]